MPFGSILNTFLQMPRNSTNATISSEKVWEVLGLRFCILFANFLHVFFMLRSRQSFCSILTDFGLPKRSLLEAIFVDFANFV